MKRRPPPPPYVYVQTFLRRFAEPMPRWLATYEPGSAPHAWHFFASHASMGFLNVNRCV